MHGTRRDMADEFHPIPNVQAVFYHGAQGPTKPDADVMFRTTFFVTTPGDLTKEDVAAHPIDGTEKHRNEPWKEES